MTTTPRLIVDREHPDSNGGRMPMSPELKAKLRSLWVEILLADLRDHPIEDSEVEEAEDVP
jgi:hypothetical protein